MAEINPADIDTVAIKKQARRRLVGAVALLLAAIIVLPLVMDHEPATTEQDIQVRIPGHDEPLASRSNALVAPEPSLAASLPATTAPALGVTAQNSSSSTAMAGSESKKTTTDNKPAVATGDADKKAEEARAAAALEGRSSIDKTIAKEIKETKESAKVSDAQAKNGIWVVRLGAFSDSGNAKELAKRLKQAGVAVTIEQVESAQGTRTRVRAGPYASQAAAEKALAKIRKLGANGSIAQKQ